MRVRLTRKLAERLDGVDLTEYKVGDILNLTTSDAQLLVAEQWAIRERRGVASLEGRRQYAPELLDRRKHVEHWRTSVSPRKEHVSRAADSSRWDARSKGAASQLDPPRDPEAEDKP